jgi:hypothetical protein
MFVGHYAPVFALAAVRRSPGLAAGFVAVQLVDIGFMALSYVGIEKWRVNPAIAGFMPIDLYYMPYTHSLAGSAAWAVAAAIVVALLSPAGRRFVDGFVIGALVLSHWFLDLIVHRRDLALVRDEGEKFGYALWDQPALVIPLELGLLLLSFALFMAATRPRGVTGHIAPWAGFAILLGVQAVNWFTPPAGDVVTFSGMGLGAYLALAGVAWWIDRSRVSASNATLASLPERFA